MAEEWKPIIRYPGYEVSSMGNVRDSNLELVPTKLGSTGYARIKLINRYENQHELVHTLVLETFVGPRPVNMMCCHLNDVPDDNRLENLEWNTNEVNSLHRVLNRRDNSKRILRIDTTFYTKAGKKRTKSTYVWK